MQSPSLLYVQESLQKKTGKNNLKTLFRVERIPSNDRAYRSMRLELRSRKKFFEHVRVLTSYHAYSDWEDLLQFMMRGLEIAYDSG